MTKKENPQIAEYEQKLAEYEEKWLRSAADLQNVRRRAEEDRARLPLLGKVEVIKALLPTLDHAELALKNAPPEQGEWERGAISILEGILPLLKNAGLEKVDKTDGRVDPNIHEVLISEGDGSTVVEILQSGWRIGEIIVRAAKVRAGDQKEKTEE